MKRIISISLQTIFISFIALSLFSNTVSPAETEISIFEAIKSNTISASFQSLGKYSGNSVHAEISNLSSKNLRIKIPAGTIYIPENEGEQTLIQLEDDFIVLNKKEKTNHRFSGFCTEANDMVPSMQNSMTIAQNKNPKLTKMMQYMKGKNIDHSAYQDAVWAITDQHNVSNIYSENTTTEEFKKQLLMITGQKKEWYSSPQQVTVNDEGRIVRETTLITGKLDFECAKGTNVHQDIHKENGEDVHLSDQHMTAKYGKITYKFTLKVRGWEEGKYYIRLHDGTNEITRYYFEV